MTLVDRITLKKSSAIEDFLKEKRILFRKASRTKTASNVNHQALLPLASTPLVPQKPQKKKNEEASLVLSLLNWHASMSIGAGLANLGNTCYLNSVLQCLTYTPALAQYLLTSTLRSDSDFCMLKVMKQHIQKALVEKSKGQVVVPHLIVKNLKRIAKQFRKFRQEDSHEFLRLVLESMQKSTLRTLRIKENTSEASKTIVHQIFGGRLRSRVSCSNCPYVSDTHQEFLDLSLEVTKKINSVKEALRHYSMIEVLDKSNAWKCSGCKRMSQAKKSLVVDVAPNVLILHLKRFDAFLGKINKKIEFTEKLDLSSFIHSKTAKNELTYRLDAVLVHSGHSVHSGHYYAFVKAPNGQWFEMNDESVRWVSLAAVMQQQAYMLFYSRVCAPTASGVKKATNGVTTKAADGVTKKATDVVTKASDKVLGNTTKPTVVLPVNSEKIISKIETIPTRIINPLLACLSTKPTAAPALEQPTMCSTKVRMNTTVQPKQPFTTSQAASSTKTTDVKRKSFTKTTYLPFTKLNKLQQFRCGPVPLSKRTVDIIPTSSKNPVENLVEMAIPDRVIKIKRVPLKRSEEGRIEETDRKGSFHPRFLKGQGVLDALPVSQWDENGNTDDDHSDVVIDEALLEMRKNTIQKTKAEENRNKLKGRKSKWNSMLDAGRLKKIRTVKSFVSNQGKRNSFQRAADWKKKQPRV